MNIIRIDSQSSNKGPADWFTGTVRIDSPFKGSDPARVSGAIVTRNGLDLKTRELLTFAMLISLGGCEPQVKGHVTGNLNVGNDRTRLIDVVTQLLPYIGYPRTLNALRVIDEVVPPTNIASAASTAH